jgi:Cu/Ag efflux protein CusF
MKLPSLLATAALLGIIAAPALAQKDGGQTAVSSAPGQVSAARTRTITATVAELDVAKRHVTLKTAKGDMIPMTLGPDVRNLDKVKVGDSLVVQYAEALSLTLKKGGKALPSATETVGAGRAPVGAAPGGGAVQQIEITADVVAVDAKQQVITLKGPQRTVDLKVNDPAQFKLIKVGDQIEAVYTQALAMKVDPAPAAKK